MILPSEIKSFIQSIIDLSIGYRDINFIILEELERPDVQSAFDIINTSLTAEQIKEWPPEWILIAFTDLGDPICIDSFSPSMCVLTVPPSGAGEPYIIADSLRNFKLILQLLKKVSINRDCPTNLEANPIFQDELENVLDTIKQQNPFCEMHFWGSFLNNEA